MNAPVWKVGDRVRYQGGELGTVRETRPNWRLRPGFELKADTEDADAEYVTGYLVVWDDPSSGESTEFAHTLTPALRK